MLKEVTPPFVVMGSTSVSGVNTYTSSVSSVLYKDTISYQANLSGTPTGIFQANVSLDYNPGTMQSGGPVVNGNWASIGSISVGSGSTSPVILRYMQIGEPYIQFQFVSSTSSGNIDVRVCGKSLG